MKSGNPSAMARRLPPRRNANRRLPTSRSGMVIICVLACLVIVTTMTMSNLQMAVRSRAETRKHLLLQQCERLCQAAIERARLKLQATTAEEDTDWQPTLSDASPLKCNVLIRVRRDEERHVWLIAATARLTDPGRPEQAIQRSQELTLPLSPSTPSEN